MRERERERIIVLDVCVCVCVGGPERERERARRVRLVLKCGLADCCACTVSADDGTNATYSYKWGKEDDWTFSDKKILKRKLKVPTSKNVIKSVA